jgi:hypothetical protein
MRSMSESVSHSAVGPRRAAPDPYVAHSGGAFVTAITIGTGHDH